MDEVQLTGTFSVTEAEEAYALSRSPWSRVTHVAGICVLWSMILVSLVAAVWQLMSDTGTMLVAPSLLTAFLAMAGLIGITVKKRMDRTQLETMHNKQQGLFAATTWTLTEEGASIVSEVGTSNVKWESFRGRRIGTSTMILFQRQPPRIYNILGRSQAGSDDEWRAAIGIVAEKLTQV